MRQDYDVLVIGSGIAGLSFALKLAEAGKRVAIITKKDSAESNTNYAQGGIAAVTSQSDDVAMHVADTLDAGDGLCDPAVVEAILRDGASSIATLVQRGVAFTQLNDGRVSLGKEGGHSKRRILHVQDMTGNAIETALLAGIANSDSIDTLEHYFAMDLITRKKLAHLSHQASPDEDQVLGLYAFNTQNGQVETFRALCFARHRWDRTSLSIFDQSVDRDGRWTGNGLSGWRGSPQYGICTISSDRFLQSRFRTFFNQ